MGGMHGCTSSHGRRGSFHIAGKGDARPRHPSEYGAFAISHTEGGACTRCLRDCRAVSGEGLSVALSDTSCAGEDGGDVRRLGVLSWQALVLAVGTGALFRRRLDAPIHPPIAQMEGIPPSALVAGVH